MVTVNRDRSSDLDQRLVRLHDDQPGADVGPDTHGGLQPPVHDGRLAADPTPDHDDGESLDVDACLVSGPPPEGFTSVWSLTLTSAAQLGHVRAEIRRELAQRVKSPTDRARITHDMVLVASELTANALTHGHLPTRVNLLRKQDTYLLDVADHCVRTTPHLAPSRAPGKGGLGLQIARHVALDVGWYTTNITKHVWARFPIHGATGRPPPPAVA